MNSLINNAHYSLLGGLFVFESNSLRAFVLILVCILSIFAVAGARQRAELVADTPTSKIKDAILGYVELYGTASQPYELSLKDPIKHEPCLWFKVVTYEVITDSDNHRHEIQIKSAESSYPLLLTDSSGTCLVYPQGAELGLNRVVTVPDGKKIKHVLTRIFAGDKLYVLGYLAPAMESVKPFVQDETVDSEDVKKRAREMLAAWQSEPAVMENFDRNNDGIIDGAEAMRAKNAALLGARVNLKKERVSPVVIDRAIYAKQGDRPFLVANATPREMQTSFEGRIMVHFIAAIATFIGAIYFVVR